MCNDRFENFNSERDIAAGTLRTVKIGGRRLIPVDAIEALLAGGDR